MEINKHYKIKAAVEAAIAEMTDSYRKQGYNVNTDFKLGDYHVDLYCEKEGTKLAFEFKTRERSDYERIEAMREIANENDIHFRVVIVRIPVDKHISVEGIEETLEHYFNNDMPSDLDCLSTHTRVVEVEQAVLTSIELKSLEEIEISGKSEVVVDLCFDNDDDHCDTESYPFTFKGVWSFNDNRELELNELYELKFDTSSYEE